MRRLYFLVPNIQATVSIVEELRQAGVPDHDIYVVGKDHHRLQMMHLHEAGIFQTTDLLFALKRGLVIGMALGILAGIMVGLFVPEVVTINTSMIIALGIFGAAVGAWGSTLIGSSTPNPRVWKFEADIRQGKLLMLVDINKEQEERIVSLVKRHHPEAIIEGYGLSKSEGLKKNQSKPTER